MDRREGGRFCLIVRGPLGVGKTTVSRAVGRAEASPVISIDRILKDQRIEEWDPDRVALRSFLRANDFAIGQAQGILEAQRSAIIEGNFYWTEQLVDLMARLPCAPYVVHLSASVERCIARDAGRPEPNSEVGPRAGEHIGEEAVRAVYGFVRPFPGETMVDASGTVEDVVTRVRQALHSRLAERPTG